MGMVLWDDGMILGTNGIGALGMLSRRLLGKDGDHWGIWSREGEQEGGAESPVFMDEGTSKTLGGDDAPSRP